MQPIILIIIATALLYLFVAIGHTNTMRRNWPALKRTIDKHAALYTAAVVFWPAVLVTYLLRAYSRELTKSRRNDWPADSYDEGNLPEFLKRQSN